MLQTWFLTGLCNTRWLLIQGLASACLSFFRYVSGLAGCFMLRCVGVRLLEEADARGIVAHMGRTS